MAQSETQSRRTARAVPTALVLLLAAVGYGVIGSNAFRNASISFAESGYLVRAWWYVTGVLTPYTTNDSTWTTPLYFYVLGWWQSLVGAGLDSARILSLLLGLLNGGLVFAICRRLTGNPLAAAAGVLLLLATPTVAFYFAMALPTALLSALHLGAIWLIVSGLGKPRVGASIVFGLLCAAMYFTRQNMILAVVLLIPLYIAAIGSARLLHGAIVVGTLAVVSAALLSIFPDKLAGHALHLPIIAPYLERWDNAGSLPWKFLPIDFTFIDIGTTGAMTWSLALERISLAEVVNALLLPFLGIFVLAALLFFVAGKGLRVLWIAPIYFLVMVLGHVIGTAGICTGCLPEYAGTFVAAGALTAALTLAVLASRARRSNASPAAVIIGGAILAVAMNVFAPALATRDAYLFFPAPLLDHKGQEKQTAEIEKFAQWLATSTPVGEPIVLIHKHPSLPYAVSRAGRTFPVQNINPDMTHRVARPSATPARREAVQGAVEAQSLWTDETLRRWLERDYDLALVQAKTMTADAALVLTQRFAAAGNVNFGGATFTLYKRKAAQ